MYYPKSQIKTNLYTNGSEYIRSDNSEAYKGYYWTNSKGGVFTGKTPQDIPTVSLVFQNQEESEHPTLPQTTSEWVSIYPNSLIDQSPGIPPAKYYPDPTDADYSYGEITRYFTKKSNQNIYYEISKEDFTGLNKKNPKLQWQMYEAISMPWDISGDEKQVEQTNKKITLQTAHLQKLPGFPRIFKENYLQFYKK